MAKFGGWSSFGGASQFGGADARARLYFEILKDIAPPGAWPHDDAAIANVLLRTDAKGLGDLGKLLVERLAAEGFPHTAAEKLPEWESLLSAVPPAGATLAQHRDAIVSRWRGAAPPSLPALRKMLVKYLNPTIAFHDHFDDETVSHRFELVDAGNGAITEATTSIELNTNGGQCGWDGELDDAPVVVRRLHDLADDFCVEALVDDWTLGTLTAGGLVAYWDRQNAVHFCLADDGGGAKLRIDLIVEGDLYDSLEGTSVSPPTAPFWLQLARVGDLWRASYGEDPADLTVLLEFAAPVWPWGVGLYVRNTGTSWNTGIVSVDRLRFSHGEQHNNVEIHEMRLGEVPTGWPEDKLIVFVHREPDDPGEYDIGNAQRAVDRAKPAGTLILVGESDCARYDDPHSLYDRDCYGL